ncbi:endonuclease/exonuclease/phosphatase family protein [Methyloligella sp. 2.7D]|uniref:endonuclease/exonuclease/phosphatase family protein n=1 Tax=unclassified Methyloligella TaxID=2625955 RepID=UPI00157CD457|nr:endonuclease/exonuclease/phosphatase family protein [Methyloligella sp. GL2]QKP76789.1 endonuclease/exonuclease/phosphatase family protein [Methyloligella sp. GL2]
MKKILKWLAAAALIFFAVITACAILAAWLPALDIVSNGLPFYVAGLLVLLLAFAFLGARQLTLAAAVLLALNTGLIATAMTGGAPQAPDGAKRFLRVATFNLWGGSNSHLNEVARYIEEQDPDVVIFQEARQRTEPLLESLASAYPYRIGERSLVILSRYPSTADGRIDRAGFQPWNSLITRWASLDVNGQQVRVAGIHLARPYYPELKQQDLFALTQFVGQTPPPLIVAGDFNMAPWTQNMKAFTHRTNLMPMNGYHPTWPLKRRDTALIPLFPIDNVLISPGLASLGITTGPRLGSDHRAVIADIALGTPVPARP